MGAKGGSANAIKRSVQLIPGVGPKMAQKFLGIGIKKVSDLKGRKPEELYYQMCARQGGY
jgi:predicted RecB family nuclease